MLNNLKHEIKIILVEHKITKKDITFIVSQACKEINNPIPINTSFEKLVANQLDKYNIQYVKKFDMITKIWLEIINHKQKKSLKLSGTKYS
jgi:hypothetical protein